MKKNFKIIIGALFCLAMLTALVACGANKADEAYKNWGETQLPKIEQATATMTEVATAAQANGDREAVIAATTEYKAVLEEVVNALAAIDLSSASEAVKTAGQQQLEQLQSELATLEASLSNAAAADQTAPAEGDEEALPAE